MTLLWIASNEAQAYIQEGDHGMMSPTGKNKIVALQIFKNIDLLWNSVHTCGKESYGAQNCIIYTIIFKISLHNNNIYAI